MSMKKIFKSAIAVLIFGAATVIPTVSASAADDAYFTLSGSGTYAKGETIDSALRINAGDPAVSFQANLSYDASKLECLSISDSGTAFPQSYQLTCSGGSIVVAATTRNKATVTPPSTVARITFRALASSGSAAVSFAGKGIYSGVDGRNMMGGSNLGATINFTAPASNPSTGGGSTPSNTNTGSGSTASNSSSSTGTSTKKVATSNTTQTAASDQTSNEGTTTGEVKDDTTTKDDKKSDDGAKKNDEKKTSDNGSAWYEILAMIIAASLAFLAGRRYRAHRMALKARLAEEAAAAAAAAKAKKTPKKKPTSKKTKK